MKPNFTRRDFFKTTLLGLGAAFLAACERALGLTETPPPTSLSVETEPPTVEPVATEPPTVEPTEAPVATEAPTEISCFKLLTPINGAELPAIGKVTFAWEPMTGATSYRLQITLPTNQIVSFNVDATTYARYLESFPMGGTFTWQVVALDENSATICITDFFTFTKAEKQRPNNGGGGGGDTAGGSSVGGSSVGGPVVGTTIGD